MRGWCDGDAAIWVVRIRILYASKMQYRWSFTFENMRWGFYPALEFFDTDGFKYPAIKALIFNDFSLNSLNSHLCSKMRSLYYTVQNRGVMVYDRHTTLFFKCYNCLGSDPNTVNRISKHYIQILWLDNYKHTQYLTAKIKLCVKWKKERQPK